MQVALDSHHKIIRSAIKKYKAYEVKTVGDSFMIAAASMNQMLPLVKVPCPLLRVVPKDVHDVFFVFVFALSTVKPYPPPAVNYPPTIELGLRDASSGFVLFTLQAHPARVICPAFTSRP